VANGDSESTIAPMNRPIIRSTERVRRGGEQAEQSRCAVQNHCFHRASSVGSWKLIIRFTVQLELFHSEQWQAVVRYDNPTAFAIAIRSTRMDRRTRRPYTLAVRMTRSLVRSTSCITIGRLIGRVFFARFSHDRSREVRSTPNGTDGGIRTIRPRSS
jgi:hypothetical protein